MLILLLVFFVLLGGCQETWYIEPLPKVAHDTLVYGQKKLAVGSKSMLRVRVEKASSLTETASVANTEVALVLNDNSKLQTLFTGSTSAGGELTAKFVVPDLPDGNYVLSIDTTSPFGKEQVFETVEIFCDYKILLVSDKPMYQPGQTMHLRALVLNKQNLQPVRQENLTLEIEDNKSNKVFRKQMATSDYGIVHATFTLADEVNMGQYRISALLGKNKAEKVVKVEKYVLPKFKVELTADKKYFLPEDRVNGVVQADYFFGKPVAGSQVNVRAYTFDVEFKEFYAVSGTTSDDGSFAFSLQLPRYFIGRQLDQAGAMLRLDAEVIDRANHKEIKSRSFVVANSNVDVAIIPEGGQLVPGIENRLFVITTHPDGTPARAKTLLVSSLGQWTVAPTESSCAEIMVMIPATWQNNLDIVAVAVDELGNESKHNIQLSLFSGKDHVVIRPNKAIYQKETIQLDILSTFAKGSVYVDLIKDRQTVASHIVELTNSKGSLAVEPTSDLFGTIECLAYKLLPDGSYIRDRRVIYVQPPSDIKINIQSDQAVYRPGSVANLTFTTKDSHDQPIPAALGFAVVDEAVFALQDMQPGLEKVYFTLVQELLTPRYQTRNAPGGGIENIIRIDTVSESQQRAATVLFSNVSPATNDYHTLLRVPRQQRVSHIAPQLDALYNGLFYYVMGNYDGLEPNDISFQYPDGHWDFAPWLLDFLVRDKYIAKEMLDDHFGGKLTMKQLQQLDQRFAYNSYGILETNRKLATLAEVLSQEDLSTTTLGKLVQQEKVAKKDTIDAWGNKVEFTYSATKSIKLRSAGPDGQFGTNDDLSTERLQ